MKDYEEYEKAGVILRKSPQWAVDLFGFSEDCMGDCISHMMWKALFDPAYAKYIPICVALLKAGKRWPDELQKEFSDRIAKTKIQYGWDKIWWQNFNKEKRPVRYVWSKITRFFGLYREYRLYRTQHGMTRDPYTHFFAACSINDQWEDAEGVHPPLSIYSPTFWAWQKYLHTGGIKWFDRYVRRESKGTPARQYVKDMALARAEAAWCMDLWNKINLMDVKPNKG